jgi:hypothetical protein
LSQPWPGYNTSIYGGLHNLSYQPEIHSVMPSDWDINVLSTNLTFFNENFFGMDPLGELQQGEINGIEDATQNRTGFVNGTIQFPSVAYKINEKSTVGFAWRFRGLLFSNISDGEFSSFIDEIEHTGGEPVTFNNDFANGFLTTWGSYGFFYSREILNIDRNRLFAGVSLNVLSGNGSAYLDLSSVNFTYSDEILYDVDLSFSMLVSEEVDNAINEDEIPLFKKIGFGSDIGITYMRLKKSDDTSPYFFKIGFSLIGLGKINYNASLGNAVNVRIDEISKDSFSDIESLTQLIDTLSSVFDVEVDDTDKVSTRLPLSINLFTDFHLHNRFFIHAAYSRQITYFGNEKKKDLCFNKFYIVPRYESKKIGVYMPFSYDNFLKLQSGIAFRWKPLVIGSGNIFSFLVQGENSTNLDIYFTTRIMINKKKNKPPK